MSQAASPLKQISRVAVQRAQKQLLAAPKSWARTLWSGVSCQWVSFPTAPPAPSLKPVRGEGVLGEPFGRGKVPLAQGTHRPDLLCPESSRGWRGKELKCWRGFCAHTTGTRLRLIIWVKGKAEPSLPGCGAYGSRILVLNYLGRKGPEAGLVAAMTCSVSWDSFETTHSLESPLNQVLFNQHLTANLRKLIQRHRKVIAERIDVDHVLKARSIREFDERYTAVAFGYRSCEEYYQAASPCQKVHSFRVPVLCLNASDDPFSPLHAIPLKEAQSVSTLALLVTARGGHIGFLEGLLPRHQSYMDRVFAQFAGAVFEHQEELVAAVAAEQEQQLQQQCHEQGPGAQVATS